MSLNLFKNRFQQNLRLRKIRRNESRNDDFLFTVVVDASAAPQRSWLSEHAGPRDSFCRNPRLLPDKKLPDDFSFHRRSELWLADECRLTLADLLTNDASDARSLRTTKLAAVACTQRPPRPAGVLHCCLSGENCITEQLAVVSAQQTFLADTSESRWTATSSTWPLKFDLKLLSQPLNVAPRCKATTGCTREPTGVDVLGRMWRRTSMSVDTARNSGLHRDTRHINVVQKHTGSMLWCCLFALQQVYYSINQWDSYDTNLWWGHETGLSTQGVCSECIQQIIGYKIQHYFCFSQTQVMLNFTVMWARC